MRDSTAKCKGPNLGVVSVKALLCAGRRESVGCNGAAMHGQGSLRGAHAPGRPPEHPAQHPPAPQRPTGKLQIIASQLSDSDSGMMHPFVSCTFISMH